MHDTRVAVRAAVLHVVLGGMLLAPAITGANAGFFENDVPGRFWPVAALDAPWVEESVEFPPVAVAVLEPLRLVPREAALAVHVPLQLLLLVAVVVVLWRGAGPRSVVRWSVWATPLVPLLLVRVDLPAVLATVVALVALGRGDGSDPPDGRGRGHDRGRGPLVVGLAVAVGVMAKLWPGALVLALWRHHRRAAVLAVGASVLATLAWMTLTSLDAPVQVVGFRGSVGWHMETVVGTVVRLVDGGTPAIENDAWRFGDASVVPTAVLGLVALGLSVAVARRVDDPARVLLTVLALGLVAAPLLSAQYAVWLLPSLALVTDLRRTEAAAAAAVVVGSLAVLWLLDEVVVGSLLGWGLLVGRNLGLVALAAATVHTGLSRRSGDATSGVLAPTGA